jgi:hypothetical protein
MLRRCRGKMKSQFQMDGIGRFDHATKARCECVTVINSCRARPLKVRAVDVDLHGGAKAAHIDDAMTQHGAVMNTLGKRVERIVDWFFERLERSEMLERDRYVEAAANERDAAQRIHRLEQPHAALEI